MQDDANRDPPAEQTATAGARAALIAARLRQNSFEPANALLRRVPWYALDHQVAGDLGHLHVAHDLRQLPFPAQPTLIRPLVVRFRRLLRKGLYPLPEAQSVWNGANARVISFLLRQIAAQGRAIDALEKQVSELYDKVDS